MLFEKVKPAKLSDTIAEQLEGHILKGVLKAGDKLPPERELAQQMDVSRPSVREALLRLEAKGLIHSRRGEGTFVSDPMAETLTNPLADLLRNSPEAMLDVLELRAALEELSASYAAKRATEADRKIIRQHFERLMALGKQQDLNREAEADAEFHMAIAQASHNVALIHVMRSMFDVLSEHICRNLERIYVDQGNRTKIQQQHRAIMDTVLKGDRKAAGIAAHEHLAYVHQSMRELNEEVNRDRDSLKRLRALPTG